MNSSGSITFTPTKDYNMVLVLATVKDGRDVKINGELTTVSGVVNSEGAYYEMSPIAIEAGTQYVIKKGSAESIVMMIMLTPKDGGTTAIDAVKGKGVKVDASEFFDLHGQRVTHPTKGLYIKSGRKVIVK